MKYPFSLKLDNRRRKVSCSPTAAILLLVALGVFLPAVSVFGKPRQLPAFPQNLPVNGLTTFYGPPDVITECRDTDQTLFLLTDEEGEKTALNQARRVDPDSNDAHATKVGHLRMQLRISDGTVHLIEYTFFGENRGKRYDPSEGGDLLWIADYVEFSNTTIIAHKFSHGYDLYTFQLDKIGVGDMIDQFTQANTNTPNGRMTLFKCKPDWPDKTDWNVEDQ